MVGSLAFIQQAHIRLIRQRQLNAAGFFLSFACSSWLLGLLLLHFFSFSYLLLFLVPGGCSIFLWVALWRARSSVSLESTASLLDGKMSGQERFLTLVSTNRNATDNPFFSIIQRQAEQLSSSFLPKQDLPFTFDRRTFLSGCCALVSVLIWLFFPYVPQVSPSLFSLSQVGSGDRFQDEHLKALEKVARNLMQDSATPQEQVAGSQLLALAQQLKDPSLTLQEKEKLVEETKKRIKLDLPFPQLLPFDLKIFASNNKEGKGEGSEAKDSQGDKTRAPSTDPSDGQHQQATSATAPGNELQGETKSDSGKKEPPQPQKGGGVTFNFPQPQTKNEKRSPQEPSGAEQQQSQNPAQKGLTPGSDPNRLGGDQNGQAQKQKNEQGEPEKTKEEQNKDSVGGAKIGQGKGQRFLQPGEKSGGGFLTEDARFVKVRIPVGQEAQSGGENYTENASRAAPKTPYSNAPLKAVSPEQAQARQPIPLEYRSILKE